MNEDHFISDLKQLPVLEFQPEVVTKNLKRSKILEFFTDSFDILKSSRIYGGLVRITSPTLKKARQSEYCPMIFMVTEMLWFDTKCNYFFKFFH